MLIMEIATIFEIYHKAFQLITSSYKQILWGAMIVISAPQTIPGGIPGGAASAQVYADCDMQT